MRRIRRVSAFWETRNDSHFHVGGGTHVGGGGDVGDSGDVGGGGDVGGSGSQVISCKLSEIIIRTCHWLSASQFVQFLESCKHNGFHHRLLLFHPARLLLLNICCIFGDRCNLLVNTVSGQFKIPSTSENRKAFMFASSHVTTSLTRPQVN